MRETPPTCTRAARLALRLPLRLLFLGAVACADHSRDAAARDTPRATKVLVANRPGAHATPDVLQRLAAVDSSVTWESESVLVADIDCDGKLDSAFVGRSPIHVAVGLIRAGGSAPDVIAFGTHGAAVEGDVGSSAATLALESLDYDPREMIGEIEGFQRSRVCQGLNLGDGETDSMHLFWNHTAHRLDWWRL